MSLVVYNSDKTSLSPISFLNDLQNQTAIRLLDINSPKVKIPLGLLFRDCAILVGIKLKIKSLDPFEKDEDYIFDHDKKDIKEMLLMRFKHLSLEEINYAFKLERYGTHGKRIEHFQLFNSTYVEGVLERYDKWKQFKIRTNNISTLNKVAEKTKVDHTEKNNDIVMRFLTEYEESSFIEENKFYVYDIINKKGLFPNNKEHKESIKKDAIYLLTNKYQNRKASSRAEQTRFKREMKNISLGSGGDVIRKCKQLFMEEFFRDLYKDNEKVIQFKKKFK
jgi:hypothetical protein